MSDATAKPSAGRRDYNELATFRQLQPGEPYFLIRAHDKLAGDAARAWAALAYEAMVPIATVEQALQQADALDEWPDKRLPDAGHLKPDEVLQLAYEFDRRCWNARSDSADPRVMMAEERAIGLVLGRLRPVLSVLFAGLQQQGDGSYLYRVPLNDHGKPQDWQDPFEQLRHLAAVLRPQPELQP